MDSGLTATEQTSEPRIGGASIRVLMVSPYPPARDGIGDYTSRLVTAMRGMVRDIGVAVPRPQPGCPGEVVASVNWRRVRQWCAELGIGAIEQQVVHIQFAVPTFGVKSVGVPRWLDAVRRDSGAAIVVTMHEVARDTALLGATGRALYRAITRRADMVVVHTQGARAVLVGRLGVPHEKVVVIPHPAVAPADGGTEPSELRRRYGIPDGRILLAFGFVHVHKGLQDLVRAVGLASQLRQQDQPPLRLVVAGTVRRRHGIMRVFELRDHLHLLRVLRLAGRIGIRSQILLTGYVPDKDVVAWFRASEAVVLPYRRTDQSGVALMAVSLGRPVLASRVGGLAELFGGSQWTFPPRDHRQLAEVLKVFLSADRGQQQIDSVRQPGTSVADVATATVRTYRRALSRRQSGIQE